MINLMRVAVMIIFILMAVPGWAQTSPKEVVRQNQSQSYLIKDIRFEGFILKDRKPFKQILKAYRHKVLSVDDINKIIAELGVIYQEAGYQNMVSFDYCVKKYRLIIRVNFLDH